MKIRLGNIYINIGSETALEIDQKQLNFDGKWAFFG